MAMALNKSTDGGTTFQQVSVDVADYTTTNGVVCSFFYSIKDSQNNTYIICFTNGSGWDDGIPFIKIASNGTKTITRLSSYNDECRNNGIFSLVLSRNESEIFVVFTNSGTGGLKVLKTDMSLTTIRITPIISSVSKFAIYKDQYIWVANGTTVKIYDYDSKAELASGNSPGGVTSIDMDICCSKDNELYIQGYNNGTRPIVKLTYNGISTIVDSIVVADTNAVNYKQLLIDRFGDLIILTNTGTASTLLKYSNTGTLIDTVNLSVGTNKGAYGLQVYSSDNGTKCWVQFSNDLGTWRTEAKSYDATPANRTFGAVRKIRDNGVTTYGDDHGGDNNYSVWCP